MAKRVDQNQAEIVAALRSFGASVCDIHSVGRGCPDIIVSYGGATYLFEIKSPDGKLTPDEIKFHNEWRGVIHIIYCVEDALAVLCDGMED